MADEKKPFWQRIFVRAEDETKNIESPREYDDRIKEIKIQMAPQSGSGTEVYAGYFQEEYLQDLQGYTAAQKYDKMRRSDPRVKMVLSAVKNPIMSAVWEIQPADKKQVPDAQLHADFIEHCLFKDMRKTWRAFLSEATTVIVFGHAPFEIVHKVVLNDERWGNYVGLDCLAWRNPKTIERWNLNKKGEIESLDQLVYGDTLKATSAKIDGKHLLVMVIDKEGDNWEGISMLRPCYGPWLRKNTYLKLQAIGIEKFAVPTVILDVPAQMQNSTEYSNAIAALQAYTSHQSNYLTKPKGWDLEIHSNKFDPEKVRQTIDAENAEMSQAFLANFLDLGSRSGGGSGSFSLAFDLSDFFLNALEYVAEGVIAEPINQKIIPELIQMKFGPQKEYPELKVSGISDKAGKELAEVLKILAEGKIIIPDDNLEKNIRKRFSLPEADVATSRKVEEVGPTPAQSTALSEVSFAEKTVRGDIKKGTIGLEEIMTKYMSQIAKSYREQLVSRFKSLPDSKKLDAIKDLNAKGLNEYRKELEAELVKISTQALSRVRKEVPGGEAIKLSEGEGNVELAEIDKLPPLVRKKVKAQASLLTQAQLADLEKVLLFHYTNSVEDISDVKLLDQELEQISDDFVNGPSVRVGAANATSVMTNTARNAFLFSDEAMEKIESFTFRNPSPVTAICTNLNGRTFAKNDPGAQRYLPPLHHNCKSYIEPNIVGQKNPKVSDAGLRPTGSENEIGKMEKQITLAELEEHYWQCNHEDC